MAKESLNYTERQLAHDSEYQRAWSGASKRFLRAAAKMGVHCEVEDRSGMAINFEENYVESSFRPNMADLLDHYVEEVIEKHGIEHSKFIWAIYKDLRKPMEEEIIRNRSFLLERVAGYLIKEEGPKLLPRVHALLHAIPGLAKQAGFASLRLSAAKCQVSVEWLRRKRDKCCHILAIPIPTESKKSDEARAKYKQNALKNHWRNQLYKHNGNHNGTNGSNGSTNGSIATC